MISVPDMRGVTGQPIQLAVWPGIVKLKGCCHTISVSFLTNVKVKIYVFTSKEAQKQFSSFVTKDYVTALRLLTVNSLLSNHPWCMRKWSLTRGVRLREK